MHTSTHPAGYKGYGLAMMVEMICGILGGGPYAHHIREWTVADRVANLVWTNNMDTVYTASFLFHHPFLPIPVSFLYLSLSLSHTHATQVTFPFYQSHSHSDPISFPLHASVHEVLLLFVSSARHLLHWIRGRLPPTLSHGCAHSCKR